MELSNLLKKLRNEKHFTLRGLASASGISHPYISRIEKGTSKNPDKSKLIALAYALDPENNENTYENMLKSVGYNIEKSSDEFEKYKEGISRGFIKKNSINPEIISDMKYRIKKSDNSIIFLDQPYMDVEWLTNQDEYKVFCGHNEDDFILDSNQNPYKTPLELTTAETRKLSSIIKTFKRDIIKDRKKEEQNKNNLNFEKRYREYELIFDLLNNQINDSDDFISRLLSIDEDREIFTAKEYHEEVEKAVKNQDALKLQRLVRMTTLKELKQYLSEQN
ncbi:MULTISPECIES: helix-turn-helix transcriptional regulator [unclassified Staphylococcus]|uniref:helix-turn-helix domain-containing protein n=1 Tax=Staphylococcus TaxID=1279 RepID=UPI001AEC0D5E|nr:MULTISPECIES: helix-turn-helix transcriptional regulator [unclassified Staphylococcus]